MTDVRHEITIEASREVVFRHLTEREGLLRWMAVDATVDPVPGGVLSWTHENGAVMVGRFVELEPPSRLVFRYGWADGRMGLAPEASTVEVTLSEAGPATRLHLIHRDLPTDADDDHRDGWRHFLRRLQQVVDSTEVESTAATEQ